MSLEYLALSWLRFAKECRIAMYERTPRNFIGRPDVIGITRAGYLYEIEIKRSLADFRLDSKKPHRFLRRESLPEPDHDPGRWPRQFWYCVPPELARKVKDELPSWAGLLRGPGRMEVQALVTVAHAPVWKQSRRLDTREKVYLAHCMANQILSFARRLDRQYERHSIFDYSI